MRQKTLVVLWGEVQAHTKVSAVAGYLRKVVGKQGIETDPF